MQAWSAPRRFVADLARKRAAWRAQARLLDQLRDRPCADCGGRFPPCAMDFDHVTREPSGPPSRG